MQECLHCQAMRNTPAPVPLHPWLWQTKPWQRIHVDFVGFFLGRMFFVVVDACAKWPEVITMSSTTKLTTINELCHLFSAYGLSKQLVVYNGPQLTSENLAHFANKTELNIFNVHRITLPQTTLQNNLFKRSREQ